LSRRPRERLRLSADGSARLFTGGPDDRMTERAATWREEDDVLLVRADDGGSELRIVERSPERLVVKTGASRARR
jgi:hypothetical protein